MILIRPQALALAGGIAPFVHEVIDDCALARAVKRSGGHVWLGLTATTRSFRPYESFGEIERMIARTAFNQLGHSIATLGRDCRHGAALSAALRSVSLAIGGSSPSVCGLRHDDHLFHGSLLPIERLGAHAASQRHLLYGGNARFGTQILERPRRRMEGSRAGPQFSGVTGLNSGCQRQLCQTNRSFLGMYAVRQLAVVFSQPVSKTWGALCLIPGRNFPQSANVTSPEQGTLRSLAGGASGQRQE